MQHRHRRTAHPRRLAGRCDVDGLSGENADRDAAIDTDLGQAAGHAPSLLVDVAPGLTESVVRLSRHQAAVGDCGGRIHLFGELAQRNSSVSVTLRSVQLFAGHKWLCVRTHTYMDNQRSFAECYAAVAIASWSASILSLLCCRTLHLSAHRHVAGTDAHFERFFVDYPRPTRPSLPTRLSSPTPKAPDSTESGSVAVTTTTKGLSAEAERRRTFAVISHPDAGKSTLTEALALHAKKISEAGAVHGKAGRKSTVSDWMEMEKARGISVSSTALQFNYHSSETPPDEQINVINLVDTPPVTPTSPRTRTAS